MECANQNIAPASSPPCPWLTIGVAAVVALFIIIAGRTGFLGDYTGSVAALVLIAAGASEIIRPSGGRIAPWHDVGRSALEGLAVSAVILPLFIAAAYAVAAARGVQITWGAEPPFEILFSEQPIRGLSPGPRLALAWCQWMGGLLTLAIAEEIFFRGWFLKRLDLRFPARRRLFGAPVSWTILLSTCVFAAAHLGLQGPAGLMVFFPGLIFGWLWERRQTIAGAVVFHFLANVTVLVIMPGAVRALYPWRWWEG
jgi:membrane protease YdiL (CAAX protease family)